MSGISISKCLRRLKNAKNDTEKFAALLMVGIKILKFHGGGTEVVGTFTLAIWSTISWTEKFNYGLL